MNHFFLLILSICLGVHGFTQTLPPSGVEDTSSIEKNKIILSAPLLKENNTVILQWYSARKETGFYTIERSSNGTSFETIAVKKMSSKEEYYDFVDELPLTGNNFYRIKYMEGDSTRYSLLQSIAVRGTFSCKFYPNPVDNLLIVKTDKPTSIYIADMTGKTRITKLITSGIQFVDVSILEKGYYIVTMTQRDENKWITEKLIKN